MIWIYNSHISKEGLGLDLMDWAYKDKVQSLRLTIDFAPSLSLVSMSMNEWMKDNNRLIDF